MSSINYKAWLINDADFPITESIEEKIKFISQYGILAPSVHNTQPWSLSIKDNKLTISLEKKYLLSVSDAENRGAYIAVGALVENICQAARYFGFKCDVATHEAFTRISFSESERQKNIDILNSIKRRSSVKTKFSSREIDVKIYKEIVGYGSKYVEVAVVHDKKMQDRIVGLHMKAAEKVSNDPDFVKELADWLRPNSTKKGDGMPGFISGAGLLKSVVAGTVLKRKPELFKKILVEEKELMESAKGIIVFSVKEENYKNFIDCGRVVERVWLRLVQQKIAGHPMTAIMHFKKEQKDLKIVIDTDKFPALLMRIGYPHKQRVMHTPRRKSHAA